MLLAELRSAFVRALLALACLWCAVGGFASSARADDLSDFEAARGRYDRHDYARAVEAFRALVGTDPPRISNALLVLESRKYYAASLLFRGAEEEARAQFRMLLQQEPDYALDPLAFPTEVVALFDEVKAALRGDLERKREAERNRQREAEEQARSTERLRQRNLARLRSLAETEQTRTENSRWLATVPFGVGQFQNGHRALGVALAMGETLAAATSVVSYLGVQRIDLSPSKDDERRIERNRQIWRTMNIASFSTFAALAVIGIVEAHVRFVPARVRATPRPLPLDLDRWVKEQALRLTRPRDF